MADVINLRQARKARKRADDLRLAEQNRTKHGRTKGEKSLSDRTRRRYDEMLDGVRREPTDD